jgi:L-asparaginase/Glu-tRNA(Gln) amidotransferase subunit D
MLPETALVKLGILLGRTYNHEQVEELMQKNIAGEINSRHSNNLYLF